MSERLSWTGDERLYQPRIRSHRVRQLYQERRNTGRPMTVVLDKVLEDYFKKQLTQEAAPTRVSEENPMYSAEQSEGVNTMGMEQCFKELEACEVFMLTRVQMLDTKTGEEVNGWRLEFLFYTPHVVEDQDLLTVLNEAVRVMEIPAL